MQFNPDVHTKAFLIENPLLTAQLAEHSTEFGRHPISQDVDVLKIHDDTGWSIAHLMVLSNKQHDWLESDVLKNHDVLKIKHRHTDASVAHLLARLESWWISSSAAKSYEILSMTDDFKNSVAHVIASKHPHWANSEASKNVDLLKLRNYKQRTVIFELFQHKAALSHSEFFQKSLLTLENKDDNDRVMQLAEYIVNKHPEFGLEKMVMMLISQGAAYKQTSIIPFTKVGPYISKKTKALMEDSYEPEISLKYAIALHSTCFHNIENIKMTLGKCHQLTQWQTVLEQAQDMIKDIIVNNKSLHEQEHLADCNCEPTVDFLNKLKAEYLLSNTEFLSCSNSNGELEHDTFKTHIY
jgi:hypothetical protein